MFVIEWLAPLPAGFRSIHTVFVPVATLVVMASAHAAEPLSIGEAERLALDAEPGRAALEARAEALDHRADAAAALPAPELRLGLNNYPIQSGGFSTEGMTNASVGIRQRMPPGDTRRLDNERFEWQAAAARARATDRGRSVLRSSRQAWLEVYYWERAAEQLEATRPFFEELVAITQSLYSVGRKNRKDVLRAELELSRFDDRRVEFARREAMARASLAEWIGDAAARPLPPGLPSWDRVPDVEILAASVDAHPSLEAADASIEATRADVALATEQRKPGWALDVGYAYRDGELSPGRPRADFFTVGVTVGLPFTRRRSIDSDLTAALRERSAAEFEREQARRGLLRMLAAEHARHSELTRRIALFDDRILAQVAAHASAALDAYQSDAADFTDVVRARIDDLETRTEYVELCVERASSYAALAYLGGF